MNYINFTINYYKMSTCTILAVYTTSGLFAQMMCECKCKDITEESVSRYGPFVTNVNQNINININNFGYCVWFYSNLQAKYR